MRNLFMEKLTGYGLLTEADQAMLGSLCQNHRSIAAHRDLIREGEEPGPVFASSSAAGAAAINWCQTAGAKSSPS